MNLKPCPFCGSDKIDLSMQVSTHLSDRWYKVAYYCKNCNSYGPRVVYKTKEFVRSLIEKMFRQEGNSTRKEAENLWNKRAGK